MITEHQHHAPHPPKWHYNDICNKTINYIKLLCHEITVHADTIAAVGSHATALVAVAALMHSLSACIHAFGKIPCGRYTFRRVAVCGMEMATCTAPNESCTNVDKWSACQWIYLCAGPESSTEPYDILFDLLRVINWKIHFYGCRRWWLSFRLICRLRFWLASIFSQLKC